MRVVNAIVKKSGWFVVEGDKDGARFELTILPPGQEREIASKAQQVTYGSSGAVMELDPVLADTLRAQMALTGWDNIFEDAEGTKPFLFNASNKSQLLNSARISTEEGVIDLIVWLLKQYQKLKEEYEAEQEKERKNSAI